MNRNFLKENRNDSPTLKKLRNRKINNPVINSDLVKSNVQAIQKDNLLNGDFDLEKSFRDLNIEQNHVYVYEEINHENVSGDEENSDEESGDEDVV